MKTYNKMLVHFLLLLIMVIQQHMRAAAQETYPSSGPEGASKIKCIEKEKQALLEIKAQLVDDYGRLSSWGTHHKLKPNECCNWEGIRCDNTSHHVVEIDLRGPSLKGRTTFSPAAPLGGKISSSLVKLQHLKYLDLSLNDFSDQAIPEFIGFLGKLEYLNLSYTSFTGLIPPHLGNLSELQVLDLFSVSFSTSTNLDFVSRLYNLRYLNLNRVYLKTSKHWIQVIHRLPLLEELYLSFCGLPEIHPSSLLLINSSLSLSVIDLSGNLLPCSLIYPWLFNSSGTLTYVDLSGNHLDGPIPDAFGNMMSLSHLYMRYSHLISEIPSYFGNFSRLEVLDLSNNSLSGYLPDFSSLSYLKELRLHDNSLDQILPGSIPSNLIVLDMKRNQLSGSFPGLTIKSPSFLRELYLQNNQLNTLSESIGNLSNLEILNLNSNHLEGLISDAYMSHLSRLRELGLSFNPSLALKFRSGWVPPFQLDIINLQNVKQGPQFPKWLQTQVNFSYLDISRAEIVDTIPNWFWDLSDRLCYLNFTANQIFGSLPYTISPMFQSLCGGLIDISSNNLSGSLPLLPQITLLDLSRNKLQGSAQLLCSASDSLIYLDISDNLLSGKLPDCQDGYGLQSLSVLNLANNDFSGNIPRSFGLMVEIKILILRNNSLVGEIPGALSSCESLNVIDLGANKLAGEVPQWIGKSFPYLAFLSLKSNKFNGTIPLNLCNLTRLKILDLSLNKLVGSIPKCISNLTQLTQEYSGDESYFQLTFIGEDGATVLVVGAILMWKGIESEFKSILGLVKTMDLSSNNLTGEIPHEITALKGLVGLNLSRNQLNGSIPSKFGQLQLLGFLDLSRNWLSGGIPNSLSNLDPLGVLDLSYNRLSGRIPKSTKLQNFGSLAYMGNHGLCGSPLPNPCPGDETPGGPPKSSDQGINHGNGDNEDGLVTAGFYVGAAIGFILGFWGICGSLLLNRRWRHTFFRSLDSVNDWLHVRITVNKARLLKNCQSTESCCYYG